MLPTKGILSAAVQYLCCYVIGRQVTSTCKAITSGGSSAFRIETIKHDEHSALCNFAPIKAVKLLFTSLYICAYRLAHTRIITGTIHLTNKFCTRVSLIGLIVVSAINWSVGSIGLWVADSRLMSSNASSMHIRICDGLLWTLSFCFMDWHTSSRCCMYVLAVTFTQSVKNRSPDTQMAWQECHCSI